MGNTEVARLIDEARKTQGYSEGDLRSLVRSLATALKTSQPRVVTTVKELDALPLGVVVLSNAGTIACRASEMTRGVVFGDDRSFPWVKLALPATVLWAPGGAHDE